MTLLQILDANGTTIVDEATAALERASLPHYGAIGDHERRARIKALFEVVRTSVADRDMRPVVAYAETIATARHGQADIAEVQAAFNALEAVLWRHAIAESSDGELAVALGMIGTVLGTGKDALARTYVKLTAHRTVTIPDVHLMFSGTQTPEAFHHAA
jgi:hypothetical protein